ncbi:hypothetical protein L3Q82_005903 [Scortum barcoo]|uniref:Uncharacterized protein n=1 Tax=Scortum barcoo TaxID=214431 RepID=A0ACB8V760_9TELE|nr:hypothetical protein L3Q82_005903 [Scortum barcoo]
MSHREEAPGKTQDTLERLCLSAGLGTPRGPPGRAGGSVWPVCLSMPEPPAMLPPFLIATPVPPSPSVDHSPSLHQAISLYLYKKPPHYSFTYKKHLSTTSNSQTPNSTMAKTKELSKDTRNKIVDLHQAACTTIGVQLACTVVQLRSPKLFICIVSQTRVPLCYCYL